MSRKITIAPNSLPRHDLGELAKKVRLIEKIGIDMVQLKSNCVGGDLNNYYYECVRVIKKVTGIKVYGAFGVMNKVSLIRLFDAGMDGYCCPIEVPNEKLYQEIRPGDFSLDNRLDTLETAKSLGLNTWSGFWFGVGETMEDITNGVEMMRRVGVDAVSIMPFIPCPYTKMQGRNPANPSKWAKIIAEIRLYMPSCDLFADVSLAAWGVRAGANGFSPILIANTYSNVENIKELRKLMGKIRF